MLKELEWLERWYEEACDGDWEHLYGISIDTLDNPGWRVKIDLRETVFEAMNMDEVVQDNGERDWLSCHIKNQIFEGYGDCRKLGTIIAIFKNRAESYQTEKSIQ